MQIANIKGQIGHGADTQLVTKAIADTGATDHLLKDRPSLQFGRKSHKRFWDYSGTIVKHACREGTQYLYAFNPNDIDEPGSALALAASTMKGITDDIISLPKIVKGMGYKCKLDGVDNGREGLYRVDDGVDPGIPVCRRAVARFSLLQQLLLLLLANTAAGCLLTSTESCCHWQSAPYLTFLNLLICPDIIAVSHTP
jgi:hypothetical protein